MKTVAKFVAVFSLGVSQLLTAQTPQFSHHIVPIMADVQTDERNTLSDGNTLNQSTTGHFMRDALGRTILEQGDTKTITDYAMGMVTILDLENRTATIFNLKHLNAGKSITTTASPFAAIKTTNLGTRQLQGFQVSGKRFVLTVPAQAVMGNTKPIQQITKVWVSEDLQLPLETTVSDSLNGTVTTRYLNVRKNENIDPGLFKVPEHFTILSQND